MDPPIFNGTGDLLAFLDHVQVWATLKGYEGERKARTLLDVAAAAPTRYLRHLMPMPQPMSYLICMNRSTFTTVVLARHVDINTINVP